MKIKRHGDQETNKTTAFWLYEFAHDLDKKAHNIDYLKDYLDKQNKNKKFNTIEEKLADIKERVGFDLAVKVYNEIEKTSSKEVASSETGCGCKTPCKKCGTECKCKKESCSCEIKTAAKKKKKAKKDKISDEDIKIMQGILNYIEDMITHEPHLNPISVMEKCKKDDRLKYDHIHDVIDHDKLSEYINSLFSGKPSVTGEIQAVYVPTDSGDLVDPMDDIAAYYQHAVPTRS